MTNVEKIDKLNNRLQSLIAKHKLVHEKVEVAEAEKARLEKKEADKARKLKEESDRKQAALEEQERLQREETRRLSGGGSVMDNSQTSVTNNSYSGALDGASDSGPPPEFAMLMGLAGLG